MTARRLAAVLTFVALLGAGCEKCYHRAPCANAAAAAPCGCNGPTAPVPNSPYPPPGSVPVGPPPGAPVGQ